MNVYDKVEVILKELSGNETIGLESILGSDLALDSLSMVTLMIELEEDFEIRFDESDLNPFDLVRVSDVVELVKKYVGEENEES
jgi:acyl carrier protein